MTGSMAEMGDFAPTVGQVKLAKRRVLGVLRSHRDGIALSSMDDIDLLMQRIKGLRELGVTYTDQRRTVREALTKLVIDGEVSWDGQFVRSMRLRTSVPRSQYRGNGSRKRRRSRLLSPQVSVRPTV